MTSTGAKQHGIQAAIMRYLDMAGQSLPLRLCAKVSPEPNSGRPSRAGSIDRRGYGQTRIGGTPGKLVTATHVALELSGRPRPSFQHGALHRCDTPACVNPDHLFWGTQKDNMQDAKAKGRIDVSGLALGRGRVNRRFLRGEECPHAKLTAGDVRRIRSDTRPYKIIAAEFGISIGHVKSIRLRRVWRHI